MSSRVQVTFWEHFFRVLPYKPVHAVAALYWHLTRRKVRARNRLRVASADLPFAYELWIRLVERGFTAPPLLRAKMEQWRLRPSFSVILHRASERSDERADRSRRSVERQVYSASELIETETPNLTSALAAVTTDFAVLLRAGDLLSDTALFHLADALQSHPEPEILYGCQDLIDALGRRSRPWFKPQWNEELFLAQDYLSDAVAIRPSLASHIGADRAMELDALMLALTSAAEGQIIHVPHIISHVDEATAVSRSGCRVAAVAAYLEQFGASAAPGPFNTVKVQWPLPAEPPLVSIIVPTKDKVELLSPCMETVLRRTTYENFEILIVDNGSLEQRTRDYLEEIANHPKVRVLTYPGHYNFSAINNFAAREARGTYLCLLNNDTEVVEPAWLTEMMRYAVRADIGAAGAKLLYEDGSIQHAGVVVGIGGAAGHAHRFLPPDEPGYFGRAHVAQFVSAVTAACLLIQKKKFLAVGGLDEAELAVAFNDVDFCLKLEKAGWRNVYVPHAVLLHHESKSRGSDMSPGQVDRFRRELAVLQSRWDTKTYRDPLHNPNLDRSTETFTFRL